MVAGAIFPYDAHQKYFQEQLLPLLSPPHRYLGAAGFLQKIRLLAEARCLLVPSLVEETSSLVTMEALACGTPVIAFRAGAMTEMIDDGRTGFLVRDTAEMAVAIERAGEIAGEECRREAAMRFAAGTMTARYFELYEQIASARQPRNPGS